MCAECKIGIIQGQLRLVQDRALKVNTRNPLHSQTLHFHAYSYNPQACSAHFPQLCTF